MDISSVIDEDQLKRHIDEVDHEIDDEDLFAEDRGSLELTERRRKFEKVKMARRLLTKHGISAFKRKDVKDKLGRLRNKYVISSPDIKDLMKKYHYEFDSQLGRWTKTVEKKKVKKDVKKSYKPTPVSVKVVDTPEEKGPSRAIMWVGRAQPWNKGQDSLIQNALNNYVGDSADEVLIAFLKDNDDKQTNKLPLDFEQQLNLVENIYDEEQNVKIARVPATSKSIVDILVVATQNKVKVAGLLIDIGSENEYQSQIERLKSGAYKAEWEQKTSPETEYPIDGDIQLITLDPQENEISPMTGKVARQLAKELGPDSWFKEVCPTQYQEKKNTKAAYNVIYYLLGGSGNVHYKESFKQDIKHIFFS